MNEEFGEFWYDLKLSSLDPLPVALDPFEAEVGRFEVRTITIKNPLNEPVTYRTLLSNTNNFSLENRQNEELYIEANGSQDVNVLFTPATIGFSDHYCLVSFYNEKVGNVTYELRGVGLEPERQDPVNVTCEIGQTQIVNVNFRNPTDSAIYCDLKLISN